MIQIMQVLPLQAKEKDKKKEGKEKECWKRRRGEEEEAAKKETAFPSFFRSRLPRRKNFLKENGRARSARQKKNHVAFVDSPQILPLLQLFAMLPRKQILLIWQIRPSLPALQILPTLLSDINM